MKRSTRHDSPEAIGCFVMLILGAMLTLGGIVIVLPGVLMTILGQEVPGLWRSLVVWVVLPLTGIALTALVTYGWSGLRRGR